MTRKEASKLKKGEHVLTPVGAGVVRYGTEFSVMVDVPSTNRKGKVVKTAYNFPPEMVSK
jgi:hypothetical protein